MRRIALLTLCLVVWITPAWAWELSQRQQQLLQLARNEVTEARHDAFWADVPVGTQLWAFVEEIFGHRFSDAVLAEQILRQEFLRSEAASLRAGTFIATPELIEIRARLLAETPDAELRAKSENQFQYQDRSIEQALADKRTGVQRKYPVQIENILSGLRRETERQRRLLNPYWSDAPWMWEYPELHLAMLSVEPVDVWSGWGCDSEQCIWRALGAPSSGTVSVVARTPPNPEYERIYADFDFRTGSWLQGDLVQPKTVIEARQEAAPFRGYPSATTYATVDWWGGVQHIASRVVADHRRQAVWILLTVSDVSPAEAKAALGKLERSIRLE